MELFGYLLFRGVSGTRVVTGRDTKFIEGYILKEFSLILSGFFGSSFFCNFGKTFDFRYNGRDELKIRFEYISSKENIPYNRGGN